ncbi:sulfatase [Croceivirga sp. JEA036]|uniref:sulfatase n=1 Tax=Croceivirga sp. JEA036 TaxID=2721162 RepID=UPI001FD775FF|nr:sulfatase [Croceivirga sp. JEA036]
MARYISDFGLVTMRKFIGILCALFFVGCEQDVKPTKNVLFILVDDFGYNDLSFRGSKFYETPNIDALAKESTIFNEGYANSRVCSPSRASIMTGKFTARHGITDWIGAPTGAEWRKRNRFNQLLPPEYVRQLPSEDITLAEALKEQGYTTFFAGKWHLGGEGSWPDDHGFEYNVGGWDSGSPKGGFFAPYNNPKLKNGQPGENLSMRLAKETVAFMKDQKEQPFFAFLSFYAVHAPIQTTQEKWNKYRNKAAANGLAASGYGMEAVLPIRQVQDNPIYGGLVESMDDAVGHVLRSLEELGLDKNTMVVFTSDNGGVASGDNYATSNLPLRGGKGYQFEGGIKEPYLIKIPWLENQVVETNVPVTAADLYPTILDAVEAELMPAQHQDGISLLPLMGGLPTKERSLIWHYPHYGNQGGQPSSIIRKGKWKLIHYYEDGRNELYDLERDISEKNNISEENLELTKVLYEELMDFLNGVDAKFPEKDPLYDAAKERVYLERMATEKRKALEQQRLEILEPNFQPNEDWWGSQTTKD